MRTDYCEHLRGLRFLNYLGPCGPRPAVFGYGWRLLVGQPTGQIPACLLIWAWRRAYRWSFV